MTTVPDPGVNFAGYRIEAMIGRGGMGAVYRASDLSLGRTVALKLIAPELAQDERFRRRFLDESRRAASLEHASVVPIYEAGETDGQLFIAMRYIEGSDLKTALRDGPLGRERSVALLGQIADALDAAHRRGLVHRDVKPANILLDAEGHAYLTDFGITKQVGGDSTDTGRMVGTLDYMAPEQIEGGRVDARTDVYALACVLYECVSGASPFSRESEAETLWAHMQAQYAPLPGLEPVLARGFARDPGGRYATCGELVEAAAGSRVPARLLRRRRAILVAGVLVLAATAVAAIVALTGGPAVAPAANGVAVIGNTGDGVDSFADMEAPPSNIAVGDGAVWVLNAQNRTIARIDPGTKRVVQKFERPVQPVDLAVGDGALWVGNADERGFKTKLSISRIDPETERVTHTEDVPRNPDRGGWQTAGHPMIAVGAGGVWTGNRQGTISRLDPATGKLVATIDVFTARLAAGREGVWIIGPEFNQITGIDPRTNKITADDIQLGANSLLGIAVGAGAIWATSEEGKLWRIDPSPGREPLTTTIDVGVGSEYVAFGEGLVWTANYVDGTVSRIDPKTNTVTATIPVGAAQGLAAGSGSAWVTVGAGTRADGLPAACGELSAGGRKPDVLIASDLPLQGVDGALSRAMEDAIRFVVNEHGHRAGEHAIGYVSCDNSTAQSGEVERRRCAANGNAYARAADIVAVIGPMHSPCSQVEIPILNRAPGGPLAMVSPTNTFPNLTRGGRLAMPPWQGLRGEPEIYYPTGERNYARVIAREDRGGAALAMLAKELGLKSVYLVRDSFTAVTASGPFRRTAARLGVGIAGEDDHDATGDQRLAAKVARSGADGVLLGGNPYGESSTLKALRASLDEDVVIMAQGFEDIPALIEVAGQAARGLYVAVADIPADGHLLTAAGTRFTNGFGATAYERYALHAAQAAEVVIAAIGRSDGTRASVLRELRATRVDDGPLGSFGFDRYGDMTPAPVTILRVTGSTPPDLRLPENFRGAVVDRVLTVPAED